MATAAIPTIMLRNRYGDTATRIPRSSTGSLMAASAAVGADSAMPHPYQLLFTSATTAAAQHARTSFAAPAQPAAACSPRVTRSYILAPRTKTNSRSELLWVAGSGAEVLHRTGRTEECVDLRLDHGLRARQAVRRSVRRIRRRHVRHRDRRVPAVDLVHRRTVERRRLLGDVVVM